jgi:protein-tyrosine phosphatase
MLSNTCNTRDLGCYKIHGENISSGKLFRSDRLDKLDINDLNTLKNLGVKRIIDFRSDYEKMKEPNVKMENIEYIELPIKADNEIRKQLPLILRGLLQKDVRQFLIDANRDFVVIHSDIFSNFLKIIINDPKPTIFHCSMGKDRTGFAALLIYVILGLDEETIKSDYLKSNDYIKNSKFNLEYQKENTARILGCNIDKVYMLEPLLLVEMSYINEALDEIKKKYKSIDEYITLGLSISNEERDKFRHWMMH